MSDFLTVFTYVSSYNDQNGDTYDSYNSEKLDVSQGISYLHINDSGTLTINGTGESCKIKFVGKNGKGVSKISGIDVRGNVMYIKKNRATMSNADETVQYLDMKI